MRKTRKEQKIITLSKSLAAVAINSGATEVVVMVGSSDGEHSVFGYNSRGACLPRLGLLETCVPLLRDEIAKAWK